MKILIDARSLGSKPSGIGIYTYNMVKELNRMSDCEILLLTDISESNEMKELKELGIEIHEYGKYVKKNFGLFLYYRFVQKLIHSIKPDIFWQCNNLVPIRIKNPYGKLAATVHDVFPITHPQYYGKIYEWYFRFGLDKTIRNFDLLIYNSQETKEETEKYFPKAKEKDCVISYIIVPRLPRIKITDNASFLYIGNLEKRKGTDILLTAYRKYRCKGGKRALRLGGKIREKDIEHLIHEVQNEVGGIQYLGYLAEEERNQEYASCFCFIFPSKAEGFGIPIIEVMNYNKPIIVTELSIYHEIMGEGILYVQAGSSPETVSERLANVMLAEAFHADMALYSEIIDRYEGKALSETIYKRFAECYRTGKGA